MDKIICGIDVGGTGIKAALVQEGRELASLMLPTPKDLSADTLADTVERAYKLLVGLNGHFLLGDTPAALGLSLACPVNAQGVAAGSNHLQLAGADIPALFGDRFGFPVVCVNDAVAAAYAESRYGAAQGCDDFVMVTLGTGFGCAVFSNGEAVFGSRGFAGEICNFDIAALVDECDRYAETMLLDNVLSATGVVAAATHRLSCGESSSLSTVSGFSCRDVFEAAEHGDTVAVEVIDTLCRRLARVLSFVSALCDPSKILIAGGLSEAGSFFFDRVKNNLDMVKCPHLSVPSIDKSTFASQAGALGAAVYASTRLEEIFD